MKMPLLKCLPFKIYYFICYLETCPVRQSPQQPLKMPTVVGITPDRQSLTSLDAEKFLLLRPQYRLRLPQILHTDPFGQRPRQGGMNDFLQSSFCP